jgi:hypothetical protein
MKKHAMLWAGVLLFGGSLMWAQNGPDRVCEVNVTTPKPGGAKIFEDGRKKHNDFHRAEKDKNAIEVWSILTGPNSGNYLTAVCGMTWKEMDGQDAFDQRDDADRQKTLANTMTANTQSYYVFRQDLSNAPAPGADAKPAKMMTVVHYFVKPGGVVQFQDAIKKINAAMAQTKYPAKPSRWYSLASGGDGPHFVLVTDRNGYSDMQPPEQTMADMLKQAYGDDKALQSLRDAMDHTMSEMMVYRADLSYTPAK